MRKFNYIDRTDCLSPEIMTYLTQIHEMKVQQTSVTDTGEDILSGLIEIAKIQSTESSNKIEGIYTTSERIKKIILNKTTPHNRDEMEIAGYRDVLDTIHTHYEDIPIKDTYILQLHRDLYRYEGSSVGGKFKIVDNIIEEEDEEGHKSVRFKPVEACFTPEAVERLCKAYRDAMTDEHAEPLLIIPMFILDFLCIHPFMDGNGRMSRLLTLLLLYKSGYTVGKYISIEKLVEKSKEAYYEALRISSINWHEETNDYKPYIKYTLGTILAAYREFMDRSQLLTESDISKPDRVEDILKKQLGTITKTELCNMIPDVSQTTIQRTLGELVKKGKIIKIGGGRYTKYRWDREED